MTVNGRFADTYQPVVSVAFYDSSFEVSVLLLKEKIAIAKQNTIALLKDFGCNDSLTLISFFNQATLSNLKSKKICVPFFISSFIEPFSCRVSSDTNCPPNPVPCVTPDLPTPLSETSR